MKTTAALSTTPTAITADGSDERDCSIKDGRNLCFRLGLLFVRVDLAFWEKDIGVFLSTQGKQGRSLYRAFFRQPEHLQ